MIDVSAAERLLNFGARIGPGPRSVEQLHGAVAIHNLLSEQKIAYLADEVGMGKTYVALGALMLFRHFQPNFRVLILAPRQNIQRKWMKEMRNFIAHNVRFPDLRAKAFDNQPAREMVFCDNLFGLVHETSLNPDRDFFARLSSFSLPLGGRDTVNAEDAGRLRAEMRRHFPWFPTEVFDLRDKVGFKDNVARAICCVLPVFDLVIVDEGHNLKHGFREHVSARNRVLSLVFGHSLGAGDPKLFPDYGPRAKRVLFLSATPVEETYTHLWNQMNVFGRGKGYEDLKRLDVEESQKKELAKQFLIRRVTTIQVNRSELTKNLYRREWRQGGVVTHDEPIRVDDARQRLVVALVQKKVNELLHQERFSASFQIGMLASFESFLQTAKIRTDDEESGNFDDADQTDNAIEKEGVDVADLNRLARSYRQAFGQELPHPKMDAIVKRLETAWRTGEKALVFVRRVASVKELKRKLDEQYDKWLLSRLRRELPTKVLRRFELVVQRYNKDRITALNRNDFEGPEVSSRADTDDRGGNDTFFAWFFRGEGPPHVVSGATLQQRFTQRGTTLATFFDDNYAALVLDCDPSQVAEKLAQTVGADVPSMREHLRQRSIKFLGRVKKPARGDRFEAVQAAAIEWLKEIEGSHRELAAVVWRTRFEGSAKLPCADEAPEIGSWLAERTFFTELRKHPHLRSRIWPEATGDTLADKFKEQELRARLLASAARLGHAFIDFYILAIRRLGSLKARKQESSDADAGEAEVQRIEEYLAVLENQMNTPLTDREWGAFDELEQIGTHFDLILDVNYPEAKQRPLEEGTRVLAQMLGRQQPSGGMAGQVNQTLVRQFRMPGYPFVLVTTDLLQEGEDLHTFCSSVHHYGISWTPSSMEQRTGRIDRVRSQCERALTPLERDSRPEELLQVYFPHLEDTVEVLQVQRVLERMNTFLCLMHEGLTVSDQRDRKINLHREFAAGRHEVPQIRTPLKTAFPVPALYLQGEVKDLVSTSANAERALERFHRLRTLISADWHDAVQPDRLFGSLKLGLRQQPFTLLLVCHLGRLVARCISPVGRVYELQGQEAIQASIANRSVKIGALPRSDNSSYDLTVEGEVLLSDADDTDASRVSQLLQRVAEEADRLENMHLDGRDELLQTFKGDLEKEMKHVR